MTTNKERCQEINERLGTYGALTLWPFEEAPEEYKTLSPHSGDEDWLLLVPVAWGPLLDCSDDELPDCLPFDRGRFGCCSISCHEVAEGWIFIGSHS